MPPSLPNTICPPPKENASGAAVTHIRDEQSIVGSLPKETVPVGIVLAAGGPEHGETKQQLTNRGDQGFQSP
jgi:hypothetical protein